MRSIVVAVLAIVCGLALLEGADAYWGYGYGLGRWGLGGLYGGYYGNYYGLTYPFYGYGYGLGGYYWRRSAGDSSKPVMPNVTECHYALKHNTIRCHLSVDNFVECPSTFMYQPTDSKIGHFAINVIASDAVINKDFVVPIYPRKLDNSAWLSNVYQGKEFGFYFNTSDWYYGVRFTDFDCYKRTVELLSLSTRKETIEAINTKITGELYAADEMVLEKRGEMMN